MSTETKIFVSIGAMTLIILVAGVFLVSRGSSSLPSDGSIISRNGIHWHPKLSIYMNNEKQELNNGIGVGAMHQPFHTHEEDYKDGVVHMEFTGVVEKEETKLGRFFDVWGKEFKSTQIFDKTTDDKNTLKMLVNGQENTEFENYYLQEGDTIEIRYESIQ